MSITRELRKWNTGRLRPDHTAALDAIADRIDKEHKRLTDKAHADGERSAMKQARSRSVDYRKGYEQAMNDMEERTKTEQNGVGITDELREYAMGWRDRSCHERLLAIADRIDKQHAEELERMWDEAEGADLRAFEATHVKLPVDADGVPIRVGDEVEFFNGNHDHVKLLALRESGWSVNYLEWNPASLRHHQPDSWERIIEDAISESGWEQPKDYEIDYEDSKETRDRFVAGLVERCRRLAGDAE